MNAKPQIKAVRRNTINFAAASNFTTELFTTLGRLGFSVVIVCFVKVDLNHPVLNWPTLGEDLGRELEQIRAGQFDSTAYLPDQQWHMFHAADLAKAMEHLKAALEKRELLNRARLMTAESPNELLTWYPPTAEAIKDT